jgi:hypothetical protein
MKGRLMKLRAMFAVLALVIALMLVIGAGEARAGWTKNYHCQLSGTGQDHRVTDASIEHWADGTHEYWPGTCSIQRNEPQ